MKKNYLIIMMLLVVGQIYQSSGMGRFLFGKSPEQKTIDAITENLEDLENRDYDEGEIIRISDKLVKLRRSIQDIDLKKRSLDCVSALFNQIKKIQELFTEQVARNIEGLTMGMAEAFQSLSIMEHSLVLEIMIKKLAYSRENLEKNIPLFKSCLDKNQVIQCKNVWGSLIKPFLEQYAQLVNYQELVKRERLKGVPVSELLRFKNSSALPELVYKAIALGNELFSDDERYADFVNSLQATTRYLTHCNHEIEMIIKRHHEALSMELTHLKNKLDTLKKLLTCACCIKKSVLAA